MKKTPLNLEKSDIALIADDVFPDDEKTGNEMQDAHQLWVNTEKLRILLYCCLLDSMGFTMQEIDTNFKTAPIIHPERYQNDFLFE